MKIYTDQILSFKWRKIAVILHVGFYDPKAYAKNVFHSWSNWTAVVDAVRWRILGTSGWYLQLPARRLTWLDMERTARFRA